MKNPPDLDEALATVIDLVTYLSDGRWPGVFLQYCEDYGYEPGFIEACGQVLAERVRLDSPLEGLAVEAAEERACE